MKIVKIDGYLSIPRDKDQSEFFDELADWLESRSCHFRGVTEEVDEEYGDEV